MNFKFLFLATILNFIYCAASDVQKAVDAILQDDDSAFELAIKDLDINKEIIGKDGEDKVYLHTFLSFATLKSAEKIINLLIKNKADINKMFHDGNIRTTTLLMALERSSIDIIELLLTNGANIDPIGMYNEKPFSLIEALGFFDFNTETTNYIINYLKNIHREELFNQALVKKVNLKAIKALIVHKVYIPINIIDIAKKLDINQNIIDYIENHTNLMKSLPAISPFPKDVTNILYEYSCNQEISEITLTNEFMKKNNFIIKEFLDNGGDPNHVIVYKDADKYISLPILLSAIEHSCEDMANILIENGANVNSIAHRINNGQGKNYNYSPLAAALYNDKISLEFVKKLLNKGADIKLIVTHFSQTIKFGSGKNVGPTKFNIAHIWDQIKNPEKKEFIYLFLVDLFKENVLDFVLENKNISFELIKLLVEKADAKVTLEIIKKAKAKQYHAEIVHYLKNIGLKQAWLS